MPELAEVETVKNYLVEHIVGQRINKVLVQRPNLRYELSTDLTKLVPGTHIQAATRRAKFIQIYLDNQQVLVIHLGMSGKLIYKDIDADLLKHDHVIWQLDNGMQLVFNDARRFGMIYITHIDELAEQQFLKNMGPEPFSEQFSAEYLALYFKNCRKPIKNSLMDNNVVVGVGNIYAAESLFDAKIHPQTPVNLLTIQQLERLVISVRRILTAAIAAGGTTLQDFANVDQSLGYFKQKLQVYGRTDQPCYNCYTPIIKLKQAGRSSFFCPHCQPKEQ